jgi:hypothetical protein
MHGLWIGWFAALGSPTDNPWLGGLVFQLLEGSPEALSLLDHNPFPDAPPRFIRAVLYDYHFTDAAARATAPGGNLNDSAHTFNRCP